MWLIRLLLVISLVVPFSLLAEVNVNDGGTWKAAQEIHVRDGGTWKAAQEVHVNDAGTWQIVFTLSSSNGEIDISFEWELVPEDIVVTTDSWTASTAYSSGDRISLSGFDSIYAEITTAGTSDGTEPTWPGKELLAAGDVVDNGDGTVSIPCMNNSFASGDTITLAGTDNYDATYSLSTQPDNDDLVVTATYAAETIFSGMAVEASGLTVTDNTATWTIKEYATDITGYKIYLNDSVLCTATGRTESTLDCNDVAALGEPGNFSVTLIHSVDGESLPSRKMWAAGYPDWVASTAYDNDDKVNAGDSWSYSAPMNVTTAGTSGGTEPTWPVRKYISSDLKTLSAAAAVDNGADTVNIPVTAHGYSSGDVVEFTGTTNYNSLYSLPDQVSGDNDNVEITAVYVAETFTGSETIKKRSGDVVDNGDGTINIPCLSHGFVSGDTVTITGTTNYDDTYTLASQSDNDEITITETFVAEEVSGTAVDKTVTDGTVVWELTYE